MLMVMSQTNFKNSLLYKKGHRGELIIKQILQEKGYFIIPSYDYSGNENNKAPKLYGLDKEYVMPDLDICKSGNRVWAEVKTKASANYTYLTKQYEHGIPLRHYEHYLKVQTITGSIVWLYIYEENTKIILRRKINELIPRFYTGNKMGNSGMAFFPRNKFEQVGYFVANTLMSKRKIKDILLPINNALTSPELREKYNNKFELRFSISDIIFLRDFERLQSKYAN